MMVYLCFIGGIFVKKTYLHGGTLYISDGNLFSVLPTHDAADTAAERIGGVVLCPDCRWNDDLPPWDAPGLYPGSPPFNGGASGYLDFIEKSLLPEAAEKLGHMPTSPVIAGYSLAGLFAAYALVKSDIFRSAVCASPSLWFDGFTDYMALRADALCNKRLYLSVGRREKRTRNRRMSRVEDSIRLAWSIAENAGAQTFFELNDGDHFADPELRLLKGFNWLSGRNNE